MLKIYIFAIMFFINSCGQLLPPNLKANIDQNQRVKLTIGEELVPKIDILFVIDNSGSMGSHQLNLKNQIEYYANEILKISAINFRIAILGSDSLRGFDKPYLTRKTPNVLGVLKSSLLIGSRGGAIEKFFAPVYEALNIASNNNKVFLRQDAALNLIFITDTDDQSKISVTEFYNFLLSLKKEDSKIITFAALIKNSKCRGERSHDKITKLNNLISISGGTTVDLCSGYSLELIELAKKVVRQAFVFKLKEVPIYESIVLYYGNKIIPRSTDKGWSYNPKTVSIRISTYFFKNLPKNHALEKLKLSYRRARPSDL
ncbi:MAG: VWA domain-containing protein [Bdellovibrionales bacterium]|nr:VWA domain-containing protein [Bdellovibrionales bacterium]